MWKPDSSIQKSLHLKASRFSRPIPWAQGVGKNLHIGGAISFPNGKEFRLSWHRNTHLFAHLYIVYILYHNAKGPAPSDSNTGYYIAPLPQILTSINSGGSGSSPDQSSLLPIFSRASNETRSGIFTSFVLNMCLASGLTEGVAESHRSKLLSSGFDCVSLVVLDGPPG